MREAVELLLWSDGGCLAPGFENGGATACCPSPTDRVEAELIP